ncbi:iron complex transport system substrate-binding protein [Sedimentibacter acidaminivorans]|uniref:Iron complex transport system substrate-binding protein n=1 Tax=Sedimentibacter acidaminivorans TaxID=913099 RepID=A0ABS4GFZ8_9FIRM|nr:ABC transporter substrate-binding protein [Sedimentibacter acidaminivorans]MBP1926620.1 iron complex transport system substrate-binding protein [Sedimentibacter acidaminivorans]
MKKITSISIALSIIISLLTSCTSQPKEIEPTTDPIEATVTLPLKDRARNEITVPKEINSIISMSPSITEVLVDLGFGDKIIAVDTYSEDIPGLPNGIPSFDMMAPDSEKLVALNPDIVFATGMSMSKGNDPFKPIRDMGICLAYIPSSDSIQGIYDDIMFISDTMQVSQKGQEIVDNMKTKIAEIKKVSDTITEKKTIYFEISAQPSLYSFGKGVFLNEMIDIIGATNILADQEQWIAVSDEAIVAANPDVIITNVDYIENAVDEIKSRTGWENVTAIKNGYVYYVDKNASSLSNHNIVKALEQMAKYIYPDNF